MSVAAGGAVPEPDAALQALAERARSGVEDGARWELLLEAVVTMAGDLSLDRLLGRIVVIAGSLVGARYAALGVLDPVGEQRLRTFVHHGMDPGSVEAIGHLPEGHGLLGLIIDRPEPLRLHDLETHPASFGFPEGHPPMHSFLGVPLRSRGRVYGNLYLTEKRGGADFDEDDERIVVALAAAAGVAIENVELLEETRARSRWMGAAADITAALLAADQHDEVDKALQVVADRAREVADADAVWIVSQTEPGDSGSLAVQAVSGVAASVDSVRVLSVDHPVSRSVIESGRTLVVDDVDTDPRTAWVHDVPGWPRIGPAVFVPLGAGGQVSGALVLGWAPERRELSRQLDPTLPARFAEQAALTLQLEQAQEAQRRLSLFQDRDRIARDLHDVVIQRLFAIGLGLQGSSRMAGTPEVRDRLENAVDELDSTIKDIRRTIFELGTSETSTDLRAEVTRLVHRAAATLKVQPRLEVVGPVNALVPPDLAVDLLAVLSETLSNTVRHARAGAILVRVVADGELLLEVVDDGAGVPAGVVESGLQNMRDRAQRRGGRCTISAGPDGRGTAVRWQVPLHA